MQNKTKWGIVNGTFFGSCWLTGMILILLYVPGDFSFRSHQVDLQVISSNIVPNICRVYRSGIDQQCYKLNVNYMYNFKDDSHFCSIAETNSNSLEDTKLWQNTTYSIGSYRRAYISENDYNSCSDYNKSQELEIPLIICGMIFGTMALFAIGFFIGQITYKYCIEKV